MLRILLLMLLIGWVPAHGEPVEIHEYSWFGINVAGGVLKIQSTIAPNVIDNERLRMMTNVDRSTPLSWHDWGNYSGYQYDYSERGSFFRQWWLIKQRTVIFVVYESSVEIEAADIKEIDRIVKSLTVGGS